MARYTLFWVLLFIWGIDWDYYQELHTYNYDYPDQELKADEDYPLTAVYYSEDERRLQTYNEIVNHFNQGFDLYPDR